MQIYCLVVPTSRNQRRFRGKKKLHKQEKVFSKILNKEYSSLENYYFHASFKNYNGISRIHTLRKPSLQICLCVTLNCLIRVNIELLSIHTM